jgi:putative Holliday junction resolvase
MAVQKYLGVDYGSARVGLAVANSSAGLARPAATMAPEKLAEFVAERGPFDVIVVGLPRGLDGQETPQTLAVRRFVTDHIEAMAPRVELQDEAATSAVAEERLRQSGKRYLREQIDAEAAAIILQDWLDHHADR